MTLQEFRNILLGVTGNVYHSEAPGDVRGEYIIWQEKGGRALYASDARSETVRKIQVELYTGEEFTETTDRILDALEKNGVAFREPEPYFDPDTKKTRYIIECEAV